MREVAHVITQASYAELASELASTRSSPPSSTKTASTSGTRSSVSKCAGSVQGVDVVKAAVKRASNDRRDQRVSDSAARAVEQGPAHVFGRATGSRINSRV